MNRIEQSAEALRNATANTSIANYSTIFAGFAAMGLAHDDIEPRVNVLTFWAWQALGRRVKKGQHGVRVCTWVPMTKKDDTGEAKPIGRKPKATTVFHISQTEPVDGFIAELRPHPAEQQERRSHSADAGAYYSDQFTPIA